MHHPARRLEGENVVKQNDCGKGGSNEGIALFPPMTVDERRKGDREKEKYKRQNGERVDYDRTVLFTESDAYGSKMEQGNGSDTSDKPVHYLPSWRGTTACVPETDGGTARDCTMETT